MPRKLARSSTDKSLYGVCGGIADFFGISSFAVRLLFFITATVSIWIYIFCVWFLEEKPTL